MKVKIVAYNPEWSNKFKAIRKDLEVILRELSPKIEHIGSTSIPGLAAKPIIDIAVGIDSIKDLNKTIEPMLSNSYIYYEAFNSLLPDRRFFVGLKNKHVIANFKPIYSENDKIPHEKLNLLRLTHIHIWEFGAPGWMRHIAFREYLRAHPEIRVKYEAIKKQLSLKEWSDSLGYNQGKDSFLKTETSKALTWYMKKTKTTNQSKF